MHDTITPRPDRRKLLEVASAQGGYFNAAQAQRCGFSRALLAHHAKRGGFLRVRHGLYRFPEYPASPREEVLAAWLAADRDVAVVSHESALDLLGLSDIVPNDVHLTVPRTKRYRSASPGVVIHTTTRPLGRDEVTVRDGMSVTSPVRSIMDAAQAGSAPEQIIAAVREAGERGIATGDQLSSAARERGGRVQRLIRQAVQEMWSS